MPLDGVFLYKLSQELNIFKNGRINKVSEVSETDFIFGIRANYQNYNLLISLSSEYARVHLTTRTYEYPQNPKSFTMLLRKYFEGNIITDIYTHELDRVLVLETSGLNELGDKENKRLVIEIMGRYSNMIVIKNNIIVESLRHIGVLENDRTVLPGAIFNYLENDSKVNPMNLSLNEIENIFKSKNILTSKEIINNFMGISPLLSNYIINSNNYASSMYEALHSAIRPIKFMNRNKYDFYYTNLNFSDSIIYESISILLDDFYYDLAKNERIKQKTNDLGLFVNKQISKFENKLIKLDNDLEESSKGELFRLYGELLIANSFIKTKNNEITVNNYYTNEDITIALDPRYNIIDNSKIYFKKYQKSKNAISHILEQKNNTIDEIEYFKLIKAQIENSNLNDILEIQDELNSLKYIKIQKTKQKSSKPKILSYITSEGTSILVGKNNLQNELITHKLSKPNDMWFHVKDSPGSHVLVQKEDELTECDIRTAAMIAAYYSPYKDSSSVPVNYTKAKFIKKIPGKKNCFVTISNEKTIFIDPSKDFITDLKSSNFIK